MRHYERESCFGGKVLMMKSAPNRLSVSDKLFFTVVAMGLLGVAIGLSIVIFRAISFALR